MPRFESPLAILKRLPGPVQLLVTGTFINKLGTFIVPYLTLVLRREFRLSEGTVGMLLLAFGAGSLVSILTGGHLTDRLGRRLTLLVSLFGSGVVAMAMGFAPGPVVFVPLLLVFGFVADLYRPAASSIIGDLLTSPERVTGFAALRMALNLGFAAGMALGGLLADLNWRLLFIGDGATTILYGVMVYLYIPETRPISQTRAREESSPFQDATYLKLAFTSFALTMVFFSHVTVLPLTIIESAGYKARVFGSLVAVNGLLIALFELSVVEKLRAYRRLRVAALGTLLAGAGFALTGMVLHWGWFLFTVLLWTAGEILTTPQKMAFVADWAPPDSRGRYLSLYQATWNLALALNPILFFPLHARMSEATFWPLMLVLAAPSAWVLLHLDRTADHPERLRGLRHAPLPEGALFSAITPDG